MDNRLVDEASQTKEIIDRALARINTCIPGIIDSFDKETQTAVVVPAISMKTFIDDREDILEYPPIVNAPIVFPFASTAGFALTLPIKRGDSCIILFSQRAIDNWHDKGGIQPSEEGVSSRHHDLTDAIVLMAAAPIPNVLGEWEVNGIQIRNRAGDSRVTVFDDKVVIDNTVEVIIDTPQTTITGHLLVEGDTYLKGTLTVDKSTHLKDILTVDKSTHLKDILTVDSSAFLKDTLTVDNNTHLKGTLTVDDNTSLGGNVTNDGVNIGKTHNHTQAADNNGDGQQDTGVPQ